MYVSKQTSQTGWEQPVDLNHDIAMNPSIATPFNIAPDDDDVSAQAHVDHGIPSHVSTPPFQQG